MQTEDAMDVVRDERRAIEDMPKPTQEAGWLQLAAIGNMAILETLGNHPGDRARLQEALAKEAALLVRWIESL